MVKMGPKVGLVIKETVGRKGSLEIMACQAFLDSEGSRDFRELLGEEERRGTLGCQDPPGLLEGKDQRVKGAPRGALGNKDSRDQKGIRESLETRDFLENLEITETQDPKASGVHLVRKEKRVEGECQEKLDLEDSQDQLDPRGGRAGKVPQAAPVTLAPLDSRGSGASLERMGGLGGRDPLDPRETRESRAPVAHMGGEAGQGGRANQEALDQWVPGAMWALLGRLATWASKVLRENLDHLENKDSGAPWDQL